MSHPDVITTIWDDPRNVDTFKTMWSDGASAAEIARALGQGVTRSAVIGKVHRLKLQKRDNAIRSKPSRTVNGREGHRGKSGGLGQSKASSIVHRVEGRDAVLGKRQMPMHLADDAGVDVTSLVGFADRRINHECAWVHGDPMQAGSGFCGKPVVEGTQWCDAHYTRVYSRRAVL